MSGVPDSMRSWQILAYDGSLRLGTSPFPKINGSREVIVKVTASSINTLDVMMTDGYGRVLLNQFLKKFASKTPYSEFPVICGRDFVGEVIATGARVKPEFCKGTMVMGVIMPSKDGSHAEYVVVDESSIVKKPENVSPEDAVSFIYAGMTAWSALTITCLCKLRPKSCRKFLLIGASGGVGTVALQLLKLWDAQVVATCSKSAVPVVKKLHPYEIVDYTESNFLDKIKQFGPYDMIFDCAGVPKSEISQYTSFLKSFSFAQFVSLLPPYLPNTDAYGVFLGLMKSVFDHTVHCFSHVPFYKLCSSSYAVFLPLHSALQDLADFMGKNQVSQRCKTPTIAPQKLERIIGQCQEEIKTLLLQEALDVIGIDNQDTSFNVPQRTKRQTKEQIQSFTNEERRVAGCLLQCVYKKVKAVDETGFPQTEGLVRLYSEGVQDRNYYYAAFTAVQQCVGIAEAVKQQQPNHRFDGGQICDLAYEMFDCVSDKIDQFCGLSAERN